MKSIREKLFPASEGLLPLISLANLSVPLFLILREPPLKLGIGLALLFVFIVVYREQFWRQAYAQLFIVIQLAIVLAFMIFYHPVYAYVGILIALPLSRQSIRFMGIISVVFAVMSAVLAYPLYAKIGIMLLFILLPPLFSVCIMPFIIRNQMNYKQMAERLKAATEQLERMAQQEERQRIAQELHDTLGHTLSLISLKGDLMSKMIKRAPERALDEANEISETARAALKQMRELVTTMRVVRLHEEYTHAKALCAAAGITIKITDLCYGRDFDQESGNSAPTSSFDRLPLSPLQESILAMCFRETLTNVVRHSRASRCSAELEVEDGLVRLNIVDDGVGIDQERLKQASGSGIVGLKQRLALVDGYLTLESEPNRGTKFALHIPRTIRSERIGAAG
jgi:two-component system, NarL family, sensor histidine kinase DesK